MVGIGVVDRAFLREGRDGDQWNARASPNASRGFGFSIWFCGGFAMHPPPNRQWHVRSRPPENWRPFRPSLADGNCRSAHRCRRARGNTVRRRRSCCRSPSRLHPGWCPRPDQHDFASPRPRFRRPRQKDRAARHRLAATGGKSGAPDRPQALHSRRRGSSRAAAASLRCRRSAASSRIDRAPCQDAALLCRNPAPGCRRG